MKLFKHLSVIILLIAFSIGGNLFRPAGCDNGSACPHFTDNRFDDIRPFKDHAGLMTENITAGTPQVITLMPRTMGSHHQTGKRDFRQESGQTFVTGFLHTQFPIPCYLHHHLRSAGRLIYFLRVIRR
ncbi:MAG: hypothetical protein IJM65_05905 [Bacteroidales bacterium]|nr:hypothetical protein [Bacteroidales bacterium]